MNSSVKMFCNGEVLHLMANYPHHLIVHTPFYPKPLILAVDLKFENNGVTPEFVLARQTPFVGAPEWFTYETVSRYTPPYGFILFKLPDMHLGQRLGSVPLIYNVNQQPIIPSNGIYQNQNQLIGQTLASVPTLVNGHFFQPSNDITEMNQHYAMPTSMNNSPNFYYGVPVVPEAQIVSDDAPGTQANAEPTSAADNAQNDGNTQNTSSTNNGFQQQAVEIDGHEQNQENVADENGVNEVIYNVNQLDVSHNESNANNAAETAGQDGENDEGNVVGFEMNQAYIQSPSTTQIQAVIPYQTFLYPATVYTINPSPIATMAASPSSGNNHGHGFGFQYPRKKKIYAVCRFCVGNGKPEFVYGSHWMRDKFGRTVCKFLRKIVCARCGATGDDAHTAKFCPVDK